MLIKKLQLVNFRCYSEKTIEFDPSLTIIHGNNASGKTTILEAIHVLGLVKSYRASSDFDLIKINELSYSVKGLISKQNREDVVMVLNSNKIKKVKRNNEVYKTLTDYIGYMSVVYYDPTDFSIFQGSPSLRRRFFDILYCQITKHYLAATTEYKRLLKERNILLKELSVKNDKQTKNVLDVVTKQLVMYGKKIISMRERITKELESITFEKHKALSGGKERFALRYRPNVTIEEYENKIFNNLNEDLIRGTTLVGPHRDDYIFIINNKNIGDYGSQGQQKSAILSVKLASVELINEVTKHYPIVLLDDVFSELDKSRQNQLIKMLNRKAQTIITTATISDVEESVLRLARVIELEERGE
ncbi:MAG: DNA replication/repair protein RecF [Bacilli bacterium]|nr:DNA replication/repair protein RecF [Bacilli bacterium]